MAKPKPAPKTPETLDAPPSCETCPSGRAHMAEERFRAVFNSVSDGIWVCDGAGRILEINPASERLNSIQAGDYIGKDVQCILKEGLVDRSVTLDVLKNKHQASLIQHIKKSGQAPPGHRHPGLRPAADTISMVVVNERDITELNTLRDGPGDTPARSRRATAGSWPNCPCWSWAQKDFVGRESAR